MAPILNSTTGMIPQIMESPALIELLRRLNALEPLSDIDVVSTTSPSDSHSGDGATPPSRDNVPNEHPELLVLVQQLRELLHPYEDDWMFDETVRSISRWQF